LVGSAVSSARPLSPFFLHGGGGPSSSKLGGLWPLLHFPLWLKYPFLVFCPLIHGPFSLKIAVPFFGARKVKRTIFVPPTPALGMIRPPVSSHPPTGFISAGRVTAIPLAAPRVLIYCLLRFTSDPSLSPWLSKSFRSPKSKFCIPTYRDLFCLSTLWRLTPSGRFWIVCFEIFPCPCVVKAPFCYPPFGEMIPTAEEAGINFCVRFVE